MPETAAAALRGLEVLHHVPAGAHNGLKDQLGHALALAQDSLLAGGIEQHYKNFAGIVRINDPHALGHREAVAGAEAAARIEKARQRGRGWLYADAGRHAAAGAGRDVHLGCIQAGAQVHAGGMPGGRLQRTRIECAGLRPHKGNAHRTVREKR